MKLKIMYIRKTHTLVTDTVQIIKFTVVNFIRIFVTNKKNKYLIVRFSMGERKVTRRDDTARNCRDAI